MKDLAGVSVAVIGLGASGTAAARLALAKKGNVYVSDTRSDPATATRGADLRAAGAAVELGGHDLDRLAGAELVVASPGIPPQAPVLRALAERGVRWISEPELAARFHAGSLIAVTGTNGKTTVTLLVEHLLRAAGMRAGAGGNVGGGLAPAASELALLEPPLDWWVLEMSSFQLGAIETFRPDIGVLTNVFPDHLDRYESVEAYYADKARLFDNADAASRWVLPGDDLVAAGLIRHAPGRRYYFADVEGIGKVGERASAFVRDEVLTLDTGAGSEALCTVAELPLVGRHNVRNALTAALTARLAEAPTEAVARGLHSARSLPHRLEPIVERGGVQWVNDSKATNVAATRSALESLDRPLVLLLGGKDKGEDFTALAEVLRARARVVLAYGAAGPRIADEVSAEGGPDVEVLEGDFAAVVHRAAELARPGDTVLLSPACSSYDMFESYEHRGRAFHELAEEVA